MTRRRTKTPDELTWWDWITKTAYELRRYGADPNERWNKTGHEFPLPLHWARTIGMWGCCTDAQIRTIAGVKPNVHYAFKHRYKLRTGLDVSQVWIAENCWRAYIDSPDGLEVGELYEETANAVGVLPVEAMLYCTSMQWLLNKLEYEDDLPYAEIGVLAERAVVWEANDALHEFRRVPRESP